MNVAGLALRSLQRQGHRTILLVATLTFCTCLLACLSWVTAGAESNLLDGSSRFYGGDISITTHLSRQQDDRVADADAIARIARAAVPDAAIAKRVDYIQSAVVYFYGEVRKVRRIIAWEPAEAESFYSRFPVIRGSRRAPGPGEVSISQQTMDYFKLSLGDAITLKLGNPKGIIRTASLKVVTVMSEASVFGSYTLYMNRSQLADLLFDDPGAVSSIGVVLPDHFEQADAQQRLEAAFASQGYRLFKDVHDKFALQREIDAPFSGSKLAIVPLDMQIRQIHDLLDAMKMIAYFFMALILVATTLGSTNSWKIVVDERRKEIGAMRAMGWQKSQVLSQFMLEGAFLAVGSIVLGVALSVAIGAILGSIELPNPGGGLDAFLKNGHLVWKIRIDSLVAASATIVLAIEIGAFFPARAAARIRPVEAMSK